MRVVLDTNILVSGLMFPDSVPGRIVTAWFEAEFDVVSSHEQLAEISRVLAYPKIRRVLGWNEQRIERFIRRLYVRVDCVRPVPATMETPRDPDDAVVLGALLAGNADLLVTGDGDLLALRERYPIETPAEFERRI